MRMPRFRFTIQRMMVAVLVASLCVWGERMRRLSISYQRQSEYHSFKWWINTEGQPKLGYELRNQRSGEWHKLRQQAFERAARYPWLPVAPGPPEPE